MLASHVGICLDMLTTAERVTCPLHCMAQVPPCAGVRVHEYECGYGLFAGAGADVVVDGSGDAGEGEGEDNGGAVVHGGGKERADAWFDAGGGVCQATPQSLHGESDLPSLSSPPWLLLDCHCLFQYQN